MSDIGGESTEINPMTGVIRFGSQTFPYCAVWPPPEQIDYAGLRWQVIRYYSTVMANHAMAPTAIYPAAEYGVTGF